MPGSSLTGLETQTNLQYPERSLMLFITACLLTFSIAMLLLSDLLSMAAIITHFFGVFTLVFGVVFIALIVLDKRDRL